MAKTIRDKFDLTTLAMKQKLIGAEIIMDDDTSLEVADYYMDMATKEIHIDFVNGEEASFSLMDKFHVKIDSSYKSVSSKKKTKRQKRR